MLEERVTPTFCRADDWCLTSDTRMRILSKVMLKYFAISPISSPDKISIFCVRSPSPSDTSLSISTTRTIGRVIERASTTRLIAAMETMMIPINTINISNFLTGANTLLIGMPIASDHGFLECPTVIGCDKIYTSVPNWDE